jgi:hypothetical protein
MLGSVKLAANEALYAVARAEAAAQLALVVRLPIIEEVESSVGQAPLQA